MNTDQIEGTAREAVGKLREGAGDVLGDGQMQGQGVLDQTVGAIQHGYGQAKEGAKSIVDGTPAFGELVDSARKAGRRVDEALQDQFGASAPVYVLASAIALLGVAVLWAGRDR